MPVCQACGLAHQEPSCPRCARIDAAPAPPRIVIHGPPSPLTNSLARSQAPDELARFAAGDRIDELAKRLGVAPAPEEMECPRCAERIKLRAKVCRFCGSELDGRRPSSREPAVKVAEVHHHHHHYAADMAHSSGGPNPGAAALLSFFVVGIGHFYAGHIGRGFFFMSATAATTFGAFALGQQPAAIFVWLFWVFLWVAGIVDAYNCASTGDAPTTTEELLPSKRRRWPFDR